MDKPTWRITKGQISFFALRDPQFEWFWKQVIDSVWEENTFRAFEKFLPSGGLYIDLGAWIGPTVLFAGAIAGKVVAVEPDPVAMSALLANLDLNPEIASRTELYNLAIGSKVGPIELYARNFGNSMTSILPERSIRKITVGVMPVDQFLDRAIGDARTCFIKIDVEGGEYELAPLICDYLSRKAISADIYLSLHAAFYSDEARSVGKWTANLARNGALLSRLAQYGTLHSWSGSEWVPCTSIADFAGSMRGLLEVGGLTTTILVRN